MLTFACRLALPDGREITGTLQAQIPGRLYSIAYDGAVDQLCLHPEKGTPSDLELLFEAAAARTGGTLVVERRGAYESRATRLAAM